MNITINGFVESPTNCNKKGKMMTRLTALIVLLMSCQVASAQEIPEPRMMFIRGGILCDTQDELEILLTGIHLNGGNFPEEIPATCGRFAPEQPIPFQVTPLEWYETPSVNTLTARFVFLPNGWTQYGYINYIPNPDYVAPSDT